MGLTNSLGIEAFCPIFILNLGLGPPLVQDLCSGMDANKGRVGAEVGECEWQEDM